MPYSKREKDRCWDIIDDVTFDLKKVAVVLK